MAQCEIIAEEILKRKIRYFVIIVIVVAVVIRIINECIIVSRKWVLVSLYIWCRKLVFVVLLSLLLLHIVFAADFTRPIDITP